MKIYLNTYEEVIEEEQEIDIDSYFKTNEYCDGINVKMSLNDVNTDSKIDDSLS